MRTISEYIIFVFVTIGTLLLVDKCTGHPALDDADARTNPYHHIKP